jgi:RHS repeat-associated protein
MPFGDEKPMATRASSNRSYFTGHERDVESATDDNPDGLDYMMARYYSSGLGRFMSPDPLPGHMLDPQTLNRYVYAGNNPIRFTDPTGLDFYLKCKGKDSDTCQGGHAGTTTTDKNGNKHFEATVIHSDKKGNLRDQHGKKYTGKVDSTGVHFTTRVNCKRTTSTGVWQRGSAAVTFTQRSGALSGFSFAFSENPHYGQDARGTWSYGGTSVQTNSALAAAGLESHWGPRPGADWISPPENEDNSTHFNFDRQESGYGGNFHTGESNWGSSDHVIQVIMNMLETGSGLHLGGDE